MLPPKEDGSSDHHTQYEGAEQDILAAKSLHSFDLNFSSQELHEESTSTSKGGIIKEDDNNSLGFGFLDKKKVAVSSNSPFDFEPTTGNSGGASSPPRASFEREEDEDEDDDLEEDEEEDNEEDDNERTSNSLITLDSSSETQTKQPNTDEGRRAGETPTKDPISKGDPMGGSTTTVDETSSSGGGGSGSATAIEVVEVLKNLEDYKTPDPVDMESSIVRANFVDFSPDDDNNVATIGDSPLIGQAQITHNPEDEDESKEFSLSLNPDLPKIRAQQIQNWLEFEKEHEIKEDSLEEGMKGKSDESGNNGGVDGGDGGGVGGVGGGANPPYDLDSLSEATSAGGTTTTTVTDADGVQRRVRFLTDPHGNILISVYLTNEDGEEQIEAVHQANGDGTYGAALLEAQLVNIDLNKLEALNVEVKASQSPIGELDSLVNSEETAISKDDNNNNDESGKEGKAEETGESEKTGEQESVPGEETGATGDAKKKKVVSADPSLSNFDEGEDIGSDSETMSTSSCSSMIEVVPKTEEDGETELEFIKSDDHDENNNEMKMDVLNLANPEEVVVQDKSPIPMELQPEKEKEIKSVIEVKGEDQFAPSAPPAAAIVDVTLKNEDGQEPLQTPQAPVEIESKHGVSSVLLNASPTQDDNSPTVAELEQELKFNPIIEQEEVVVNVATVSSPVDQVRLLSTAPPSPPLKPQANKEDINGNQVIHVTSPMMQVEGGFQLPMGDEPEKQLESLCIQEEPISAVALTIAKWESLSKKQAKPKEPVERTNSAPKGNKLVLPSYTGNGGPPGNNAMNTASIAQHQIHGKPVQVLPTGCNLNGILQSKMLGLNNGSNSSVPGSPTSRSESPANNKLSAAGWSAFNNNNNNQNAKVPTEIKTPNEEEEAIYAQPNAHGGSLTTSLANPSSILKSYPKPNSKGEIINWFKEGEIHRSGILLSYGQTNSHQSPTPLPQNVTSPVIVSWFFGLITRQQAEEFLHDQPNGTFLVRISTRIWGYTLSYQSNNKTKHFLISAINPAVASTLSAGTEASGKGHAIQRNPPTPTGKQQMLFPFSPGGRYAFIGTNMTPYTTLASLIRHHSHAPITKAGGEKLTTPCPSGPKIFGLEYVFK